MRLTKKLATLLLVVVMSFSSLSANLVHAEEQWPDGPYVNAVSAIVMEAETGAVLYEKSIHQQHYPASITKIMTTLLALEHCSLDEVVTFSYDSVHKIEGTHIGIREGEQLTMEQCLYAIMLGSANEVSYAVAEHVGGSFDNFVAMMNEKAVQLGCTETSFANPHGLPNEAHLTSAHDMALIAQAAYANDTFRSITKTVTYTIPATNKTEETRYISNHHKMLKNGEYKYEACTGGKTGYTNVARNTLVTYAEKNNLTLICVIMKDDVSKDQYLDTEALLDYGFNNFTKLSITDTDLGTLLDSEGFFPIENTPLSSQSGTVQLDSNAHLILPTQTSWDATTHTVDFTGNNEGHIASVRCTLGEHFLGNVAIHYTPDKTTIQDKEEGKNKQTSSSTIGKVLTIIIIVLCVLILLLLLLLLIRNRLAEADYSVSRGKSRRRPRRKAKRRSQKRSEPQPKRRTRSNNKRRKSSKRSGSSYNRPVSYRTDNSQASRLRSNSNSTTKTSTRSTVRYVKLDDFDGFD